MICICITLAYLLKYNMDDDEISNLTDKMCCLPGIISSTKKISDVLEYDENIE